MQKRLENRMGVRSIFKWYSKKTINIFTTRPDTIFWASFIALSVDRPLSENFKNNDQFLKFKKECDKPNNWRSISKCGKSYFKTNSYVKHPFIKNKKIPIYFANFVLMIMDLELFLLSSSWSKRFWFAKIRSRNKELLMTDLKRN